VQVQEKNASTHHQILQPIADIPSTCYPLAQELSGDSHTMAEKKATPINKMNNLHGIIIRSTVDEGQIVDIQLPKMDSHFLIIAARDIPGNNRIQILDNQMPLLASSQISYKGQPILALFGHDFESVELTAREIQISYKLPPSVAAAAASVVRPRGRTVSDF
jgi:xanthine dehydrogenase molybdopterin-binding subunit B